MQLDMAAGKAPRPVRAVELKQPSGAAIGADTPFRRLVFLNAALCHLQSELQHIQGFLVTAVLIQIRDHRGHIFFPQGLYLDSPVFQPGLQLRDRVGVLKAGQLISSFTHLIGEHQVASNCLMDQFRIDPDSPVIDPLVHVVKIPFLIRHRETLQHLSDVTLCAHILGTVIFELLPALQVMLRKIPCPATVGFCRLTGNRKVFDQVFTGTVLLFTGLQHFCRVLQGQRQGEGSRMDHGTPPTVR